MANTGRSAKMSDWWSDPANRELVKRRKLEAEAKRLGTTVEALERPRVWASLKVRVETYLDLFLEGKTRADVMRLYPRETASTIQRAWVEAERILRAPGPEEEEKARQARKQIRAEKAKAAWTPEKRAAHAAKVKAGAKAAAEAREAERLALLDRREQAWKDRVRDRELQQLL